MIQLEKLILDPAELLSSCIFSFFRHVQHQKTWENWRGEFHRENIGLLVLFCRYNYKPSPHHQHCLSIITFFFSSFFFAAIGLVQKSSPVGSNSEDFFYSEPRCILWKLLGSRAEYLGSYWWKEWEQRSFFLMKLDFILICLCKEQQVIKYLKKKRCLSSKYSREV